MKKGDNHQIHINVFGIDMDNKMCLEFTVNGWEKVEGNHAD